MQAEILPVAAALPEAAPPTDAMSELPEGADPTRPLDPDQPAEADEPALDAGTGLLFAPVATAPAAAPASAPLASRPAEGRVEGALKRLLPSAEGRPSAATRGAAIPIEGEAGAGRAAMADAGSATTPAPLTALTEGLAEAETAVAEEVAPSPAPTASATAPARESGARHYQGVAPAQAQVEVPVGRPGWSAAVVDKLMWFSAQQISSAEIHLNPAELGPVSVRISTHQEQTSVYFTSHHAAVREALDQSLPRLREMFESQGMQLLDAGVGDQQARQQASARGEAGRAGGGSQFGGGEGEAEPSAAQPAPLRIPLGLVDAYA